ncbi:MAG: replication-associated recombination protein A [Rickettsiales bacterium]|nr:replication-associated recombination protein A [Rickettsiales bacterium]
MQPLANKIRPQTLDECVGQEHLIGKNAPLRIAIENHRLFSFILYGPCGVGKTTISRIYAQSMNADYYELSAVSASKDDIKKIIDTKSMFARPKILFLDEIHRFNKAQQDFLLPYVENGELYLIGATTENPSFEVIAPLLSRCNVFVLNQLTEKDIKKIIKKVDNNIDEKSLEILTGMANGDARFIISVMENIIDLYGKITEQTIEQAYQNKSIRYDKKGEEHYNTISAFIKSLRASQADSAVYYLARMIDAGEDPLFIARRMVIFASEDVGFADRYALMIANAVFQACQEVGLPECKLNLAHGAIYLAKCKKDRRANDAIALALEDVRKFGNLPIPLKIRNGTTKMMKQWGYGKNYTPYDKESYLPDKLKSKKYFTEKTDKQIKD